MNYLPFESTWVHGLILVGSVLLIFLVFCVVFFGGVLVAHLFSFLCCVFGVVHVPAPSCVGRVRVAHPYAAKFIDGGN